ncbi:MAG: DNA recombination protein RmuC [Candidatus Andersenbacteria bacterium]
MTEQVLLIIIGAAFGAAIIWLLVGRRSHQGDNTNDQLAVMQRLMAEQLDRMGQQVDRRLQENVLATNESKDFLANRVSAAERSVRSVSAGLGKLAEATTTLQKTSDEIASFQTMLKSPKIRGSFGEVLLGNLMAEVLPLDRFEQQYTMRSSGDIADAIIRLQDGYIVAVDAKFPLANYEAFVHEQEEDRKIRLRKEWLRDVKKHIKDISSKYISSQEQTLDYAFMYIPIEGVYYETMVKDADGGSLWEFCLAQHVIPVSPNSFLAYLQTVLVGLRGMKIEQQAREILQHLGQLRQDFGKFAEDFTTVGTHLSNAKNRYDDSSRRLDKFTNRLDQIEGGSPTPMLEKEAREE